jgi:hypothetical protein
MFMAVRRARAVVDSIGLPPEQAGHSAGVGDPDPGRVVQLAIWFRDRRLRVAAQLCAAHLVGTEHRGTTRADRDMVHLLDERLEVLTAFPRREGLARQENLLRTCGLLHADRRHRGLAEVSTIEFSPVSSAAAASRCVIAVTTYPTAAKLA